MTYRRAYLVLLILIVLTNMTLRQRRQVQLHARFMLVTISKLRECADRPLPAS